MNESPLSFTTGELASSRDQQSRVREPVTGFTPHPLLRNPHVMTVLGSYWPRNFSTLPRPSERLIDVESGTQLLAKCHWQTTPQRHPTMVLVHGLDGSSESAYMVGTAGKAFAAGFNVVRMNQRNCGGTEHLTPTLDNAGLADDYRRVLDEFTAKDGLPEIFFVGYSVGGNLVLKMAGELGVCPVDALRGICAVSPCLDLELSSTGSGHPRNLLYETYFLRSMRSRLQKKAELFPERYGWERLPRARTLREWDETISAPAWGYRNASEYYRKASALPVIGQIRVPTLIITAQDDPFIPIESFRRTEISGNPFIRLVVTAHGGHCAFISASGGAERFWAESRVVEFCLQNSTILQPYEKP
jgi:predicted alpha/beta-fold hydrolase